MELGEWSRLTKIVLVVNGQEILEILRGLGDGSGGKKHLTCQHEDLSSNPRNPA